MRAASYAASENTFGGNRLGSDSVRGLLRRQAGVAYELFTQPSRVWSAPDALQANVAAPAVFHEVHVGVISFSHSSGPKIRADPTPKFPPHRMYVSQSVRMRSRSLAMISGISVP